MEEPEFTQLVYHWEVPGSRVVFFNRKDGWHVEITTGLFKGGTQSTSAHSIIDLKEELVLFLQHAHYPKNLWINGWRRPPPDDLMAEVLLLAEES